MPDGVADSGGNCLVSIESNMMARKPNYRFERMERDKNKASKKLARQKAKEEKSEQRKTDVPDDSTGGQSADERSSE